MLTSIVPRTQRLIVSKRLFLDSCVLIEMANSTETADLLQQINASYSLIFSTPSLLEVGFGPQAKISDSQSSFARKIYSGDGVENVGGLDLALRDLLQVPDKTGALYSYNPSHNEWYAARHTLIDIMTERGTSKIGKQLRIDALIYTSAWNNSSCLITNNSKDFQLLYEASSKNPHGPQVPYFTLEELRRSISEDICFDPRLF